MVFICRSLLEKQAGETEKFLKAKHYVKFRRFFGRWKSAKREDGKFIQFTKKILKINRKFACGKSCGKCE